MIEEGTRRGAHKKPESVWRIACINANGIAMKAEELQSIMMNNQIDYLFISETWLGENSTRNHRIALSERYKGKDDILRRGPGRAHYGTAVMLHPKHDRDRSCLVRKSGGHEGFTIRTSFKGLEIAGVYLRNSWSATECIEVLSPLATDTISPAIIMGDWNTPFGGIEGEDGNYTAKDREILGWLSEQGGQFELLRPQVKEYTRYGPSRNGTVIDHIAGNAAAKQLFIKAFVLGDCDAAGSDHRVVVADFQSNDGVRLTRAGNIMNTCPSDPKVGDKEYPRFRVNKLKEPGVVVSYQELLAIKLRATEIEMQGILEREGSCSQETIDHIEWEITLAITATAEKVLGVQTVRVRGGHVLSVELRAAKRHRRQMFQVLRKTLRDTGRDLPVSQSAWEEYKAAKKAERKLARSELRRAYQKFAAELDELPGQAVLKVLSRMKKAKARGDSPSALTTDAGSMEIYRQHTQAVYGLEESVVTTDNEGLYDDLPSNYEVERMREDMNPRFNASRVEAVIKQRPNASAPGKTGVTVELLKAGGGKLIYNLSLLFRIVYKYAMAPKRWQEVLIIPIPKKGDLTKFENYRPIVMTEVIRKVFEKCLLVADLAGLDASLDICQGGFRAGRSGPDQVACLQEAILLKRRQINGPPALAFLDIKAAYDTVRRDKLWVKLENKGCNRHTVSVLKSLFDHNTSFIRIGKAESEGINHERGLLQGSILSPILYATFIDDLAGQLRELSTTKMHGERTASFFYADDIAIIADSQEHLQRMLDVCEKHSRDLCYAYAPDKCKIVAPANTVVRLNGTILENVPDFIYLGIPVGGKGVESKLFGKNTAKKTNKTIGLFRSLGLNAGGFSMKTKISMIKTFIRPQLEYGLALMDKTHVDPLQRALNYAMRAAFSVPPNTSSKALRALTGIETVEAGRVRASERFVNRAALAGADHLKSHAWASHRESRVGFSIFNKAEKLPRIKEHLRQWDEKIPLPPEDKSKRKETYGKLWNHREVSESQPDPRRSKVNLRRLLNKAPKEEQSKLCKWILRRPLARHTPCTNCILGKRATTRHMQDCTRICIDSEIKAGKLKSATRLIGQVMSLCAGGTEARYRNNLERYVREGPRATRRGFGDLSDSPRG